MRIRTGHGGHGQKNKHKPARDLRPAGAAAATPPARLRPAAVAPQVRSCCEERGFRCISVQLEIFTALCMRVASNRHLSAEGTRSPPPALGGPGGGFGAPPANCPGRKPFFKWPTMQNVFKPADIRENRTKLAVNPAVRPPSRHGCNRVAAPMPTRRHAHPGTAAPRKYRHCWRK